MIDWIKVTVGINLVLLNIAYIYFWIWAWWREYRKENISYGEIVYTAGKKRMWVAAVLMLVIFIWLFIMPIISTIYRHTVVFYARMTYSDSTVLCNELKDYGYICTEDKNKVIQK